jgi:hypothetical protein
MDFEPGPMQGDYWLYDEPPRIIYETRKLEIEIKDPGSLRVGEVLKLPDGTICEVAAFDKDGQPWCTFQEFK